MSLEIEKKKSIFIVKYVTAENTSWKKYGEKTNNPPETLKTISPTKNGDDYTENIVKYIETSYKVKIEPSYPPQKNNIATPIVSPPKQTNKQ